MIMLNWGLGYCSSSPSSLFASLLTLSEILRITMGMMMRSKPMVPRPTDVKRLLKASIGECVSMLYNYRVLSRVFSFLLFWILSTRVL